MEAKIKRILSLILSLLMALSLFNGLSLQTEAAEIDGHKLIASSETYELYMCEDDLSLIVKDKKTGAVMESAISYDDGKNNDTWLGMMKSAVVITMIHADSDTQQADLINDKVTKNIKYNASGFSADIYWTKYKLGLSLEVSLNDNELLVSIPDSSIHEDGDSYYFGTISVYPFMGNSYLDTKDGYMYIPDGNGALIYLDDKEGRFASGYSAMIYGSDIGFDESSVETLLWDDYSIINKAEQIIAPTFGMAHTSDKIAYLGIVEEGAARCSIMATPNGANVDYNRVYARFLERKRYIQPTSNNSTTASLRLNEAERTKSNLAVRYIFLGGEKANYAGMANAYRNYLIERGMLSNKDCSYKTRLDFLGTDRESWVIGTQAVTMTTVDDIRTMLSELNKEGVNGIFSLYKGWQDGGLYNVPITKYKAASQIGGTKKLTALLDELKGTDVSMYLYSDALRINPDENNATFNTVKKANKKKYTEKTYKDVYEEFQFLIPSRTETLTNKLVKSYTAKGVNTLALSGISNNLFSYYYSGNANSRGSVLDTYANLLDETSKATDLVLEQPFACYWDDTNAFVDMPLYDSEYIFEDTFVPFLSIVLKGVMPIYSEYINFEANKQEFFLKMVETGSFPSFYLTKESSAELIYTNSCDIYSSEYDVYKDTIISYSKELSELNELVKGAFISAHDIFENAVTRVTYDNGVKIYINYSTDTQTVDGLTLESQTYKVVH